MVFGKKLLYAKTMMKKLILLGFGLALLIGLPLTIFILQTQTQPTTKAAPVTKFSFSGPTSVALNQNFDENLVVDPSGQNQVSFVKFTFTFDPTYIATISATPVSINQSTYTLLEGPTITCATLCTITATISVGSNQNAIIKSPTTIATIHFTALANTPVTGGTQLLFVAGQNQALSVSTSDQAAENVFESGTPQTITIGATSGGGAPTDTPVPGSATDIPTPTGDLGTGPGSDTGSGGTTGTNGTTVACTSFTVDKASGNPPLQSTFTTVGSSPNDTITQLVVTYGDGSSDTITSGSGIGTGSVNNQITHTYSSNGTFTASASLTTAGGATSDPTTCKLTITVGNGISSVSATPMVNGKLPSTGPGDTFMIVGGAGAVISILGLVVIAAL